MSTIQIDVDMREVERLFRGAERQMPYAAAQALNKTALDIKAEEIAHHRGVFTVRRPGFVDRADKIKPFATRSSPTAIISLDPPGNQARADILGQHEEGGTKKPRRKSLAIGAGARTNRAGIITRANRPRALDFVAHGNSGVMRGKRRHVLIRDASGLGAIFRRVGKGEVLEAGPGLQPRPPGPVDPPAGVWGYGRPRRSGEAVRAHAPGGGEGAGDRAVIDIPRRSPLLYGAIAGDREPTRLESRAPVLERREKSRGF